MNYKPIRILHYIGSLNTGGSQAMIMEIYRNIDKTKIQFDFIVDRKNELKFEEEIKNLGGKVYKLNCFFKGNNFLEYRRQWNDFFKTHTEYKIIHCHVRSTASIVISIAKNYNLKTICHCHSTSNGKGIKGLIKNILQFPARWKSDYLFACSQEAGRWMYGKKEFTILKNSINSEKFLYNSNIRAKQLVWLED